MNQNNFSYKSLVLLTLVIILMTVTLGACGASSKALPASQETSGTPTGEPASTTIPNPGAFNENMLKNASYSLPDIGEVQLKDGHFEQKYGEGATQVNQVDFNKMAVGDLNNDGIPDAAVILAVNTGGISTTATP